VRVLGVDPAKDGVTARARMGVLLDHDGHYDRLTARQNLDFHAAIRGMHTPRARRRIDELLRDVGLWEHRDERVAHLSKGMRQKLAVARALVDEPRLLLLDEPFTGLDPTAAIDLRDHLRSLASTRTMTILLTTHDLHHAEKICDSAVVLDRGRVSEMREIGAKAAAAGVSLLVRGDGLVDALFEQLVTAGTIAAYRRIAPDRAIVDCVEAGIGQLARALVHAGVDLRELSPHRSSLEERFLEVVQSAE